jgi:hypothetical protein
MIPATVIATHRQLPLYTLKDNKIVPVGGGYRMNGHVERDGETLFVDDTIGNGNTLNWFKEAGFDLLEHGDVAVMYGTPHAAHRVTYCHKPLPVPHMLEWNFFNAPYIQYIGLDLDGVVCKDPPDGMEPLHPPLNYPCRAIITARPEKWREGTKHWLRDHGVKYHELIMWPGDEIPGPDEAAAWKARQCLRDDIEFYIESCPVISQKMREHHVRVLCIEEGFLK